MKAPNDETYTGGNPGAKWLKGQIVLSYDGASSLSICHQRGQGILPVPLVVCTSGVGSKGVAAAAVFFAATCCL